MASATAAFVLACGGLAGMAGAGYAAGAAGAARSCGGDGGNYGAQLLGTAWPGGFTGVPVYSNGPSSAYDGGCQDYAMSPSGTRIATGTKWQCVELVNRLFATRGWINATWTGNGGRSSPSARDSMYDKAPPSLSGNKQPQGAIGYLNPGDVVSINVYHGKTFEPDGHVLIVSAVNGSNVTYVSQNAGQNTASTVITSGMLSGGTLTVNPKGTWTYSVIGVVHAPAWAAAEAPMPANASAGGAALFAVTCATATSCAAVGSYETRSPAKVEGLMVTGTGTTWTPAEASLPTAAAASPNVRLYSVACPSASSCVAVGSYNATADSYQALLVSWNGSTWATARVHAPGGGTALSTYLNGVACASASSCVAVGGYEDASGAERGLILTGSGTTWTPVEAPLPADASTINPAVSLNAAACPAASSCVIVGGYDASSGEPALLLTGSGRSWTPIEGPAPAGAGSQSMLSAVACPSTSFCTAAGYFSGSSQEGLLVSGAGTTWTGKKAPLPAGARVTGQTASLGSVACPSATTCVAAGSYYDTTEANQGVLVTGSGKTWVPAEAPAPAGYIDAALTSVACPGTAPCVAAGTYNNTTGLPAMVLTGSGSTWTATEAPLPPDGNTTSPDADVYSAACEATASCIAVGRYLDTSNDSQPLLLLGPA